MAVFIKRKLLCRLGHILFLIFLQIFIQNCHGKVTTKCNIGNSSTAALTCNNNEQISINVIFYYQSVGCSQTGSCNKPYRQVGVDFSPECQHVYGKCSQPLNHTVLDDCIPDNYSITVEVNYDCQVNQSIEGRSAVQVYGTSNTSWDVDISCPQQSYIYIDSVAYWKLHNNSTCKTSTWWIPVIIPSEQIRLNNLCIKQLRCQPVLLYNVATQDGCQLGWPNIGAEIKYRCISNVTDVCSTTVRTNDDSLSTIYLTSPPKLDIKKVDSSCSCRIYGNKMDVRVLYLNLPTINSTRGSLDITPPSTSQLNLTTASINTLLYSTISDLMVTFDDKNLTQQNMLLEFKAIKNDSFLQINCTDTYQQPTASMFTFTTAVYTYSQSPRHGKQETNDAVIIGIIIGSIILVVAILMIIILLLRRRISHNKKSVYGTKEAHANPGFQDPSYVDVTRPYSLATDPDQARSAAMNSKPEGGYDSVDLPGLSRIRVKSKSGTYEDVDLHDILERDERNQAHEAYSQYADIEDFSNSSLLHSDTKDSVDSDTISQTSLVIPKSDRVEYARVNKLSRRKKPPVEVIPCVEIRLNDRPLNEPVPPPIPDKNLTEEDRKDIQTKA